MAEPLKTGLIGFGNIGAGVVRLLAVHEALLDSRLPRGIRLTRIADLDTTTLRDAPYDPAILSPDANALIDDPGIDVVIELVGGLEPARTFVERALRAGKHVVTANKAMMAVHGPELNAIAREKNVALLFEAAVGGGIPIIRALQQGLSANVLTSIQGIINGTANYILTQMEEREISFDDALREAQERGYAEPDPSYDIDGQDTAHKIAVLASLGFGQEVRFSDVATEGIRPIQLVDITYAAEMGYRIKLLGIAKQERPGAPVEVRVHPTLVPRDSQLAAVSGVFNAIQVNGEPIGPTVYYGQGAGPAATSSAVVSDLMALASQTGEFSRWLDARMSPVGVKGAIKAFEDLETHYYLRFTMRDEAGVIAKLSQMMSQHGISIESMIQRKVEPETGGTATVLIVTHLAREGEMRAFMDEAGALPFCVAPPFILRVEE